MAATTTLGEQEAERWLNFSPDRDIWHEEAPKAIRLGYQSLDDEASWRTWAKHLNERRHARLRKVLPGRRRCLLLAGSVDEQTPLAQDIELLCSLGKHAQEDLVGRATAWLEDPVSLESCSEDLLLALAWCHALPRLALRVPSEVWWRVLGRLIDVNASARDAQPTDLPVAWQLLGGELALSLAWQFPELQARDDWRRLGQQTIDQGLADLLSPEGVPHASHLSAFGELVACWTRASAIWSTDAKQTWGSRNQKALRRAVISLARLTRKSEAAALETAFDGPVSKKLLKEAARAADQPKCTAAVARAIGAKATNAKAPQPSLNSERAQTALLRAGWQPEAPRLAITYAHRRVETELYCEDVLWSGRWELEVSRQGQALWIESAWEEVCAESDGDADYVEVEARFTEGVRVQRQMLLLKKERFLFLADALLSEQPAAIDYCSVLPLMPGVSSREAEATTELRLSVGSTQVQVLPLALSEWRSERRLGNLSITERGLELRQAGMGPCLFAPLLIDLKPGRFCKPLTWRQLTVAEHRQIVPPGEAVGYRVQIGKKQWLVYRSLGRLATRSVLGQNLAKEFLFARFPADTGEAETLLEVEP